MIIYTDGASRGNPGAASTGIILIDDDGTTLLEKGQCIGKQTNNVAEYTAVIFALREAALFKPHRIDLHSDSQLLVRQLNGEYKVKQPHLKTLRDEVRALADGFDSVTFIHVRREQNTRADAMANRALDAGRTVE